MIRHHYQVGGSLKHNAPSYVTRQADTDLYTALLNGELCYVFNARQMGKSSLRVRTQRQLRQEGMRCVAIDMTHIGSEDMTRVQWYKGLSADVVRSLGLWEQFNFKQWWQNQGDMSPVQRFGKLLEDLLLVHFPDEKLFIFIDEIDSLLSLPFAVDDFFALVRYCYNQRAESPEYQRLNWALFGVTTPSELIRDRTRTPFNIGRAIELRGFGWEEAQPLMEGLIGAVLEPMAVLREILRWTGGQPFLTQKLCALVVDKAEAKGGAAVIIPPGTESYWVEQLVQSQLIQHWQTQDQPEHLRTIRDRLLRQGERTGRLLGLYQQILESHGIAIEVNTDQTELLLSGLVERVQDQLRVKNWIYRDVFNLGWVREQLTKLRPYSQAFDAWIESGQQDKSRLLRGQALADAVVWSRGQQLGNWDYRYLAESAQLDRLEEQQALEAARLREVQVRLSQERQTAKLQRLLLVSLSVLLAIALGLSSVVFWQYRHVSLSEIRALAISSNGLFPDRQLESMVAAIKAKRQLQALGGGDAEVTELVDASLRQVVYGSNEFNRLTGHRGSVLTVAISPDGQLIATGSNDKTVKIWRRDGTLLRTLKHSGTVHRVAFSPDGRSIVAACLNGKVQIWDVDGNLLRSIEAHKAPVWGIAFSPDGQMIASASGDRTIRLWRLDGTLIRTLNGHQNSVWNVAFSPDSKIVASGSVDRTVKLWQTDGTLLRTLADHQAPVWDVAFCPATVEQETPLLASVSSDRTVKLWQLDGTLARTLKTESVLLGVDCQSGFLAASTKDNTIKLWKTDGTFRRNLLKHLAVTRDVALTRAGTMAASASEDSTVKLWQQNQFLSRPLYRHEDTIWEVASSPDSQFIAAAGGDQLTLWQTNGTFKQAIERDTVRTVAFGQAMGAGQSGWLMATGGSDRQVQIWQWNANAAKLELQRSFGGLDGSIYAVAFNPKEQTIAAAGDGQTIKIWTLDGKLLHSFWAHHERIWKLAFSPDGQQIASASEDGTVKLWKKDGTLLRTFQGHEGVIWGMAFSPGGDRLVSVSRDDTINIWRTDGTLLKTIPAQSQGLTRVAWSPDGETIATAGVDNTVKLWSVTGQLLKTLPGHRGMVVSLTFTPDGHFLVSGGDDNVVIVWDLERIEQLDELSYACNWLRGYLKTSSQLQRGDRSLCDGVR
jgi:WD40 repeat protein